MAERFREESVGTRFREEEIPEEGLTDVISDIDFSLDDNTEDLTSDIDFSLDNDNTSEVLTNEIDFSLPSADNLFAKEKLSEIRRYFSEKISVYAHRDSILMDAEQLSRLCAVPIFIMGLVSALMFYFVLVHFAEVTGGPAMLLILICIFAGIVPSFIIIPNTFRISQKTKEAKLLDTELRDFYADSPYKNDIPYEFTNPYIISELIETALSEDVDNISDAGYILMKNLDDERTMSVNKKQADSSDSEEIAGRAAALYVLGKRLLI